jgi:hypothetical protein
VLLLIPCMECRVPGGFTFVTYQDSGRYQFTCTKGHKTVTILQVQKFEVLFEIGANAINDGYFREAITSFASSLERFYEFAMRVLLVKMQPAKPDFFDKMWKPLKNSSERQLGAFIATWSAHYGEALSLLTEGEVKLRNDVVHKGRIPMRDEAVSFGQRVLDLAREQIATLRSDCEEGVRKETHRYLLAARCTPGDNEPRIVTSSGMSTIGLYVAEGPPHHTRSLEDALVQIAEWRQRLQELGRFATLSASLPIFSADGSSLHVKAE